MTFRLTQAMIDKETVNPAPGPVPLPPECAVCASSTVKIRSVDAHRGRLFLTDAPAPSFDATQALALCDTCWARWMFWRARMGFDLHTHARYVTCGAACMIQHGSRRAQFQAQTLLFSGEYWEGRKDGFFIAKAIDGRPTENNIFPFVSQRIQVFFARMTRRNIYYESLGSAADAQRIFLEAAAWNMQCGVPRPYIDHVMIVVEAFESWRNAPRGVVPIPGANDSSIGLHAVLLTHYTDGGAQLGFINSWGGRWGNRGYGTLSYEYLEQHFHDATVVRSGRFGPMSWKRMSLATSAADARALFLVHSPIYRQKVRIGKGDNWQFCIYDTESPTSGAPVACVEIANGFGEKMGWTFLRQADGARGAILEVPEIFVWPTFRRMGIGSILADYAVGYARMWECPEIHVFLNEADAVLGPPRQAARLYGSAMGYEWRWRQDVAPRRVATGIKRINLG